MFVLTFRCVLFWQIETTFTPNKDVLIISVYVCVCVCVTISSPWAVHGEVRGLVGLQAGPLHSGAEHLDHLGVAAFTHVHLEASPQQESTSLILKRLFQEIYLPQIP